jgi:uncharacterized membrane protein YraQ (UPF0718 family)
MFSSAVAVTWERYLNTTGFTETAYGTTARFSGTKIGSASNVRARTGIISESALHSVSRQVAATARFAVTRTFSATRPLTDTPGFTVTYHFLYARQMRMASNGGLIAAIILLAVVGTLFGIYSFRRQSELHDNWRWRNKREFRVRSGRDMDSGF